MAALATIPYIVADIRPNTIAQNEMKIRPAAFKNTVFRTTLSESGDISGSRWF